jgi:hypothetical protein
VREGGRSALECGSLLPLSLRPACWPVRGAWAGEAASKLAGSKRQQAAALQSACFRGSNESAFGWGQQARCSTLRIMALDKRNKIG